MPATRVATRWPQQAHHQTKAHQTILFETKHMLLCSSHVVDILDYVHQPSTRYLAPEHTRGGKATTCTDVYAFGVFMLEVACGRRPIKLQEATEEDGILVDWVSSCWKKGTILEAVDPKLEYDYVQEEVESVMKLALMCSQSEPSGRPTMRQNLLYLNGAMAIPDLWSLEMSTDEVTIANREGFSDFAMSYQSSSITKSLLFEGR